MKPIPFGPGATALAALPLALLSACGGGSSDSPDTATPPIPVLAAATPASLAGNCTELAAKLTGLANTKILATSEIADGGLSVGGHAIAAHCLVVGEMFRRTSGVDGKSYAIGFEMRLPKAWNGRFYYQANGGLDGNISPARGELGGGPLTGALDKGFAVISSNAGHASELPGLEAFGIDPQARLDYGYQAITKLTPMAKELIRIAYGKGPDRSYIGGCSNGGRHSLVAAARYPDQFDGYLIGAPGYNLPKAAAASVFGAQRYATVATDLNDLSTAFTDTERRLVSNAVLAKCDALDGATDGLIQDVAACQAAFSLSTDVPTCSGARDGTCLSQEQKAAIGSIFAGATTSDGKAFYASFPYDSGIAIADFKQWEFTAPWQRDSDALAFTYMSPPESPVGFNQRNFVFNTSIDKIVAAIYATSGIYAESSMSFMTPPNPTQLGTLKQRGAKMMVYHGASDAIFSILDTEAWYRGLQGNNGGDAGNFARFFRVPGMGHCKSGMATDQFDMLDALVQWVEKAQAPERIIATARGAGNPGGVNAELPGTWSASRTRPLCPYPKVARYLGSGSLETASSFECR